MEQILLFLKPLVESYAGNYGIAIQIVSIVGSLRVALKPLMSGLKSIAEATYWTTKDNEFLAKLENSKIYTTIVYILDWIASIKFPTSKK